MLAGAALALASRLGRTLPSDLALLAHDPVAAELPPGAGPAWLGTLHESLLGRTTRKRRGAFYTPADAAERLVGWALAGLDRPVVLDPACGGGAFLLAAARHTDRLVAVDVDPLAVAVTEAALVLATGRRPQTLVADALVTPWPECDAVVGNPPFLSQLDAATARSAERSAAVGATGYVDDAALFLLAAARHAPRVALLQPESVVSTRDAAPVRRELASRVERVWVPERPLFDAAVRVVGVVLGERGTLVEGDRWAPLLATARGVPEVHLDGEPLGDHATVTAGFRDEYYGLAPHVREGEGAPLITSGLLDPNRCRWGEAAARFGGHRWAAPAVDVAGLAGTRLGPWAERHLVPKVLVATQTKVVEAAVDEAGDWLPCTPVLAVLPGDIGPWHLLAALLAPPASAWAFREASGAALSGDALKLSAAQLRRLPLPPAGDDWDAAAAALQAGDLDAAGVAGCRAYGVEEEPVLGWWRSRLPWRP